LRIFLHSAVVRISSHKKRKEDEREREIEDRTEAEEIQSVAVKGHSQFVKYFIRLQRENKYIQRKINCLIYIQEFRSYIFFVSRFYWQKIKLFYQAELLD
jgi:hypothetical protein